MVSGFPVATSPLSGHAYSDVCTEAIYDILAFLHTSAPQDYTRRNTDRVIAGTLQNDHDSTETLLDAKAQCYFGRTVGTVQFIQEELRQMQVELRQTTQETPSEFAEQQTALLETALTATQACIEQLNHRKFSQARKWLQSTLEALQSLHINLSENDSLVIKVRHATALAWELMNTSPSRPVLAN